MYDVVLIVWMYCSLTFWLLEVNVFDWNSSSCPLSSGWARCLWTSSLTRRTWWDSCWSTVCRGETHWSSRTRTWRRRTRDWDENSDASLQSKNTQQQAAFTIRTKPKPGMSPGKSWEFRWKFLQIIFFIQHIYDMKHLEINSGTSAVETSLFSSVVWSLTSSNGS